MTMGQARLRHRAEDRHRSLDSQCGPVFPHYSGRCLLDSIAIEMWEIGYFAGVSLTLSARLLRAYFACFLLVNALALSACTRGPTPGNTDLSAGLHAGMLEVAGRERSYLLYLPPRPRSSLPLMVVLHGSKQTAASFRRATGYAFERLANEHGFAVLYPNGYRKHWNDCRAEARYAARKRDVDDVGFLMTLVHELSASAGVAERRVMVVGYSNGGQLAFRIAAERPERVAAIAVFGASLPTAENWACRKLERPVSALLINGTDDPINPFEGGEVSVFGFRSRGDVRSSLESAQILARLAQLERVERRMRSDGLAEEVQWSNGGPHEVTLLAVQGGGHVVPSPHASFPNILGNMIGVVDGPELVWRLPAAILASALRREHILRAGALIPFAASYRALLQRTRLGPATDVTLHDETPIPDLMVSHVRSVVEQAAIQVDWRKGDLIIVDNHLVLHGRRPFIGAREIGLAWSEASA